MADIYIPNRTVYNRSALLNFVQTNEVYKRDEIFNTVPEIMLDAYNNSMDILINPNNEDPPKVVRQFAFCDNVLDQEINLSDEIVYRSVEYNETNSSSIIDKKIVINDNDLYCNESINNSSNSSNIIDKEIVINEGDIYCNESINDITNSSNY
jgi:hypothetical protein